MTIINSKHDNRDHAYYFQEALKQITPNGPRKYVFCDTQDYDKTQAATSIPAQCVRMPMGELCAKVACYSSKHYAKYDLQVIQTHLADLRQRIEEKRSGNFIKRIWIVFLSSLYNLYHGFGFKDSLTLVDEAMRAAKVAFEAPVVTDEHLEVESQHFKFNVEEQAFLKEVFADKNIYSILYGAEKLIINGKTVDVMHLGNQAIEIKQFPNYVFKFYKDHEKEHPYTLEARQVCIDKNLDRIIVPQIARLKFTRPGNEKFIQLRLRPPVEEQNASISPEEKEQQLQILVEQLTVFLLSTHIGNVIGNKTRLKVDPEMGLWLDLTAAAFDEKLENCLTNDSKKNTVGLMGYYPQYAQQIYDTAKKCCNAEQWKKIEQNLNKGFQRAKKILERKQEIQKIYRSKNITKDSPAIPKSILDGLEYFWDKPIASGIINVINNKIKNNCKETDNLVFARRFHLSTLLELNFHEKTLSFIQKSLFPKLKELGVLLYSYNADEALEYDLDLDDEQVARDIKENDFVFQF